MANIRNSSVAGREADKLSGYLTQWLQELKLEALFVTCVTCTNLGPDGKGCSLYPGAQVPAHVVVSGCPKYKDVNPAVSTGDDIPF